MRTPDTLPARRYPAGLRLALLLLVSTLVLVGCSGGTDDAAPTASSADPSQYTAIIDVRTPAEYASGHVEGAQNIDVNGPDFDQAISELATDGTYLVYCRTGNRSAQAAARMRDAGLTAEDGGGLQDMIDAGYPTTS
ncbi:MAG: rhodanese-like domain-containing protein [Actinomycetales bacterium]